MPTAEALKTKLELVKDIASFTHDPYAFALYTFPWGTGELAGSAGPRGWQADIMRYIGSWLKDPATRYEPCKIAVSSGHGIGKSALLAMIITWAMSTCEDCKVVVTAGTGAQLTTKTAPEVSKWFRKAINTDWWDINAQSIRVKDAKHQAMWRTDFVTWSEHNTEAFAGLHNQGKRIVIVKDEGSAIGDKVYEVTEGALTDENTEIIYLVFGNPTRNTGRFRELFGSLKHRWKTFQIDSRTVEGTNKSQIAKWAEDYGEDSDFFRVRVRGEFPRAGSNQFIPSDVVAAARKYESKSHEVLPKVLSVDVARFGDDQTVVGLRQGRLFRVLAKYRGLDTVQVAHRVSAFMEEHEPSATIIDGDGLGAGVVDNLKFRGYEKGVHEFHGNGSPEDPTMYFNKRAEVWGEAKEWLTQGAQIPDDPELEADLTGVEYDYASGKRNGGSIQLEAKDDMKLRGLASPDCGDCLAMTFAVKIAQTRQPAPDPNVYRMGDQNLSWMG